jgi:hypothetical protein
MELQKFLIPIEEIRPDEIFSWANIPWERANRSTTWDAFTCWPQAMASFVRSKQLLPQNPELPTPQRGFCRRPEAAVFPRFSR